MSGTNLYIGERMRTNSDFLRLDLNLENPMKTLNDMNEYKEDFHCYDIIDGKEVTVNDVHLTACLFFRGGHLQEMREHLRDCISQYMALFGEHITWGFNSKNRRWTEKPFDKLPSFNEILE